MKLRALILLCGSLAGFGGLGAEKLQVTGTVLDADGKPAADVSVAASWCGFDGVLEPNGGTTTKADGAFAFSAQTDDAVVVLAMNKARTLGGIQLLKNGKSTPLTIKLAPLIEVRGEFTCSDLGKPLARAMLYPILLPEKVYAAEFAARSGAFSLKLPPGSYLFNCYGTDTEEIDKPIELRADTPVYDLKVDLPATPMAKHYGKAPPEWNFSAARGIDKNVKLADLKGKWVFLEFWGFW